MAIGDPCDVCGAPIPAGSWGPTKRCSEPCRVEARRRRERAAYAGDPAKFIGTVKRYQERNPDLIHFRSLNRKRPSPEQERRGRIKYRYGITVEQYDAMAEKQGGRCAVCRRPEARRLRGVVLPLSVDHDHETGLVRGLLCSRCNMVLGYFDDPEFFAAATDYLRRHSQQQEVI